MTKELVAVGKTFSYGVIVAAIAMALFRGGVGALWGSHSDFGLVAAILLAVAGIFGLLWLIEKMAKDVMKTLNSSDKQETK